MAAYCAAMAMVPVARPPKPAAIKQLRIAVGTVGAAIELISVRRNAAARGATAGPRRRVLFLFAECFGDLSACEGNDRGNQGSDRGQARERAKNG